MLRERSGRPWEIETRRSKGPPGCTGQVGRGFGGDVAKLHCRFHHSRCEKDTSEKITHPASGKYNMEGFFRKNVRRKAWRIGNPRRRLTHKSILVMH